MYRARFYYLSHGMRKAQSTGVLYYRVDAVELARVYRNGTVQGGILQSPPAASASKTTGSSIAWGKAGSTSIPLPNRATEIAGPTHGEDWRLLDC
jgi:hypothetical protein